MHAYVSDSAAFTVFGAFFVAAILVNWWLARRNARALAIEPSHFDLLVPLAVVGGIAGATGLAMLPPVDQQLAGDALSVGIRPRLYGIVISAAVVVFVYSRLNRLRFRTLLDAFALPTLAAVAVHRLGCHFAGCCWGDLSIVMAGPDDTVVAAQMQTLPWLAGDWVSWAVRYGPDTFAYRQQLAAGLIDAGAPAALPVHPVQLYEVGLLVLACLVLRRVPVAGQPPGRMAAAVTMTYVIIRFAIEYLRADGTLLVAGLTLVQLQCILILAVTLAARYAFGARLRLQT